MSINTNYPNVRPSLLLDFANAQTLDPRVTFSRSTTAPYYDGKTSVLAEQNLLLYSNTFSNAAWVATSATIASGVTDPAGGTTAFSMTATAGNATLYQTLTLTATAYTESIWIQRVTGTGTINLTLDGSTLSPVTITGSWAKYTYTATPSAGSRTIGIQIVTSGDAINIYGSQLENRSSATATNITTTVATSNYIPQLLTAPINAPRFDFNPTTGESLGLLIEQSSTNLLTYSQDFTNAVWAKSNATITATANIAPDGTQTAQLLVENTATSSHGFYFTTLGQTTGQTYTQSVYAKAKERTWIVMQPSAFNPTSLAYFNLGTGVVGSTSNCSSTITAVGNGWYRCTVTYTALSTGGIPSSAVFLATGDGGASYLGNGYSGAYVWQNQIENLAFATSPIATTSAQVTRASDNASMTGTNFSSWFNNGQGTLYCEMTAPQVSGVTGTLFEVSTSGTSNNRVSMRGWTSNFAVVYQTSIALQQDLSVPNRTNGAYFKSTISYGSTSDITCVNGTLSGNSYTSMSVPATQLVLGNGSDGTANNGFWFKKFAFYPNRVTNAQLQALTGS